ncbi:unnamed protein product [Paramecium sonneborni]|uniref:Uncharacterized protein n=1 Tax=Paramecium sonneborni TaxID=65129 RepID=A0A8S1QWV5_9CILI|nr:unnamed protein product [Paramecium sonneborni]
MGICKGKPKQNGGNFSSNPLNKETDMIDENLKRIKKQFDDLTLLLECMSQEFKAITDSIIKLQMSQQQQNEK